MCLWLVGCHNGPDRLLEFVESVGRAHRRRPLARVEVALSAVTGLGLDNREVDEVEQCNGRKC